MPSLSVILPNFNHAAALPRALDALLAQCCPAEEVLVVDDGSSDASRTVIEGYARAHGAVRLIALPRNVGVAAAFNAGLEEARGHWVYGAAADDRVRPGFFDEAMQWATHCPETGVIFGQIVCHYDDHRGNETQHVPDWNSSRQVSAEDYLKHLWQVEAGFSLGAATIYQRTALRAIGGFDPALGSWADTFAARVLGCKHGAVYLTQPCVGWSVRAGSHSHHGDGDDPQRLSRIGAAAAARMRRSPLDEWFPPAFVDHWALRWQLEMAGGEALLGDALVRRRLRDVRRAYAQLGRRGRTIDRALSATLRIAMKLADRRRGRARSGAKP